jgi:hypothetical protein
MALKRTCRPTVQVKFPRILVLLVLKTCGWKVHKIGRLTPAYTYSPVQGPVIMTMTVIMTVTVTVTLIMTVTVTVIMTATVTVTVTVTIADNISQKKTHSHHQCTVDLGPELEALRHGRVRKTHFCLPFYIHTDNIHTYRICALRLTACILGSELGCFNRIMDIRRKLVWKWSILHLATCT